MGIYKADYVVIKYSSNGEILDYKIVGHSGAAYTTHVSTLKRGFGIVVEQRILDDVSLLRQYKNLVYTIYKKPVGGINSVRI